MTILGALETSATVRDEAAGFRRVGRRAHRFRRLEQATAPFAKVPPVEIRAIEWQRNGGQGWVVGQQNQFVEGQASWEVHDDRKLDDGFVLRK
jgi:hypothetical protein